MSTIHQFLFFFGILFTKWFASSIFYVIMFMIKLDFFGFCDCFMLQCDTFVSIVAATCFLNKIKSVVSLIFLRDSLTCTVFWYIVTWWKMIIPASLCTLRLCSTVLHCRHGWPLGRIFSFEDSSRKMFVMPLLLFVCSAESFHVITASHSNHLIMTVYRFVISC